MERSAGSTTLAREPLAAKVPAITAMFWVIKVLTTGMGEACSDFLGGISIALAGVIGVAGFVVAMWLQFRARRYTAPVYWFAVAMVAVFGTMVADALDVALGIPYIASTAFYAAAVAVVFIVWRRSEGTVSIHTITTRRREVYYWLAVLFTFALGTAAGDLTATDLGLGFFASGELFAVIMVIPALGWWKFGMNSVFAFWFAYVVTRPLGASFADWFGKPPSFDGGLGFGDGTVTLCILAVVVLLVAYVTVRHNDIQDDGTGVPASAFPDEMGDTAAVVDR